jgi:hypothetical protein
MVTRRLIIAVLLMIDASNALASSCTPLTQSYLMQCKHHECSGAFFVAQVPAYGQCGRRHEVMDVAPDLEAFLAELAEASALVDEESVYVMRITPSWWPQRTPDGSLESLFVELESGGDLRRRNEDVPLRRLSAPALAAEFHAADRHWLTRDDRFASVDAARTALQRDAWVEHAISTLRSLLDLAGVLLTLGVLVKATRQFFERLHRGPRANWRVLGVPVSAQVVILALTVGSMLVSRVGDVWPGVVFAPAALVILLAEGASWHADRKLRRATRRQALTPPQSP